MRLFSIVCISALFLSVGAFAKLDPNEEDARKVFNAAFERDEGDRMFERLKMTLKDGRGRKKERLLQRRMMKFKGGYKTLLIFETPGDLRNTGLLSVRYDKTDQAPDQWLYLPGLGRTTRISTKNRSGSFLGSDLSYADLVAQNPNRYDVQMLAQDAPVNGQPCWHLRVIPKTDEEKSETGYAQREFWISKRSLVPLQMKGLMSNERVKYVSLQNVRNVDGVWSTGRIVARTVKGGEVKSETVIDQLEVAYDQTSVRESDFTTHRLEQGL